MKADLHMHSTYSDGADSLDVLFQKALERKLTHISVVDHDTTAHIEPALQLAEQYGVQFIPGIEISAFDFARNRKVHILGYDFTNDTHIKALCDPLLQRRHQHSLWQLKKIQDSGFALSKERAMSYVKEGEILYKQHIMNALTEADFTSESYQKLYRSLFKGEGIASGDIEYIDAFDAVRAICADGGYAVLAHPGQLDSFDLAKELVTFGLSGIEVIHPDHSQEDADRIKKISSEYNLFQTGGSDDHGRYGASSNGKKYVLENIYNIPFIK
ncbi:PHP domain-containing protein [Lysinibacillus yapensis]|uniref:PHP domain-containing protein n=1 Tax=Ureibacillus yapensis TaxID=2304605 RepID=A0A396S644_9BACL|nr:PHP domain-containing protein [Lysinibacillus yapensis]RHW35781.1 PHP domain-containing protein [Lysinibacillus yapensis]